MTDSNYHNLSLATFDTLCPVCKKAFKRRITFFTGGWSRCSVCDQFVHYSCLESGVTRYFKRRPRVCHNCSDVKE